MHTYSFEKLDVWIEARRMITWIYKVTNGFPPEEKFGLTKQMHRVVVSVVSNIADGSACKTPKD